MRADTTTARWRAMYAALACAVACGACGKNAGEPAAKGAAAVAAGAASALPASATATAAATVKSAQELAAAYHAVRCALVGAAPGDLQPFVTRGFASGTDFSQAFAEFARRDPAAAERTIADSYRRGCAGDRPAAGAHP
ncbi:MAG: hypothetical protein EXR79_06610 [Myxococcales bacterium]|nr:hypothetical protein [Myxococcales bacterium]